jgi:hypothetical protein
MHKAGEGGRDTNTEVRGVSELTYVHKCIQLLTEVLTVH